MQRELGKSYEALLSQIKTGSVTPEKVRDVTLIPLVGDVKLVIACDSNASIGEKKNDYYKNAYEEVAVSAMKVPLMEVLATGAVPVVVVDNLCMEMEGAGKRIISIMRRELEEAGLSNVQLTGSTEDNMPTTQSGFGVTAIGLLEMRDCRIGSTRRGDRVVCVACRAGQDINRPPSGRTALRARDPARGLEGRAVRGGPACRNGRAVLYAGGAAGDRHGHLGGFVDGGALHALCGRSRKTQKRYGHRFVPCGTDRLSNNKITGGWTK